VFEVKRIDTDAANADVSGYSFEGRPRAIVDLTALEKEAEAIQGVVRRFELYLRGQARDPGPIEHLVYQRYGRKDAGQILDELVSQDIEHEITHQIQDAGNIRYQPKDFFGVPETSDYAFQMSSIFQNRNSHEVFGCLLRLADPAKADTEWIYLATALLSQRANHPS